MTITDVTIWWCCAVLQQSWGRWSRVHFNWQSKLCLDTKL